MRISFIWALCLGIFMFFAICVPNAYAYLDPGTGSYFFQIVIAFIAGGLFAIKLFWRKIVFFIKNLFSRKK